MSRVREPRPSTAADVTIQYVDMWKDGQELDALMTRAKKQLIGATVSAKRPKESDLPVMFRKSGKKDKTSGVLTRISLVGFPVGTVKLDDVLPQHVAHLTGLSQEVRGGAGGAILSE